MITAKTLQRAKEMYVDVFGYNEKFKTNEFVIGAEATIAIVLLAKELSED